MKRIMTISVVLLACSSMTLAVDKVTGLFTTAGMTGSDAKPHGWVDQNIYVGPLERGFGAGAKTTYQPSGYFEIPGKFGDEQIPGGRYALFALNYDGIPAFSYDFRLRLPDAGVKKDVKLGSPAHYSVMYDRDYKQWGEEPWIEGVDFYQTFVATSKHVTRLATKLSSKSGDHHHLTLNFAIYETNDGPPSEWKRISPVRSRYLSHGTDPIIHIFWVSFQSKEVVLEPGKTYAARFWRNPISQAETFWIVARPDKGDGYKKGHLYVADEKHKDLDGYAYISGGMPGTVVNHVPVEHLKQNELIGGAKRFGQTFKATGIGLAAIDIIYATGETTPKPLEITIDVFDKPGGKKIAPTKICRGLPLTFQGRAAAIWQPGEVTLKPGQMYYLEWASTGCNTWKTDEDLPGHAFRDGKPEPKADLALSIAEYTVIKKASGSKGREARECKDH